MQCCVSGLPKDFTHYVKVGLFEIVPRIVNLKVLKTDSQPSISTKR